MPRASRTVRVVGVVLRRDLVAERRPAAVREVQREHHADGDPRDGGEQERRPDPAGLRRRGRAGRATSATSASSRKPSRTPQPIEPNSHSPRNSTPPIRNRSPATHEDADRRADERDHPLDLVDDVGELGLREVDVGAEQPLPGRERRAELGAKARRLARIRPAGGRIRPWAHRRRVVCHGTSEVVGRARW